MSRWIGVVVLLSAVCSCSRKMEEPGPAQAPAAAGAQVAAQGVELRERPVVDAAAAQAPSSAPGSTAVAKPAGSASGSAAAAGTPGSAAVSPPGSPNGPAAATKITPAVMADAKALFSQRCTLCHGLQGKGNGPASASLSPRPQDYTVAAWQNGISDAQIRQVIVGGGPAVGKSMMMPPNPDLADKPAIVEALVHIVRGFRK
jgi:cytochrome c551/c552